MKRSKAHISIGMPVYNGGEYLKEAIASILSQSYTDFELIISDDCSNDTSKEIYTEFAKKDPRLRIYKQKTNIGSIANFNFVLEKAKGEFFMWAAQDDIRDKYALEKLLQLFSTNSKAVLAVSNYKNMWKDTSYSVYPDYNYDNNSPAFQSIIDFLKTENLSFFYGLHKTENLKKANGYHIDSRPFFKSSDFLTIYKALLRGKLLHTPEVLFYKRDTGLYTEQFKIISEKRFDQNTRNKIARYLFFPLFYFYDLAYGIYYATQSHYSLNRKINIIINLHILFLRRISGFIKNILVGLSHLI